MPVTLNDLETAVRAAIQVTHMEVEDKSDGCGNSYFVLIVSKVVDTDILHILRELTTDALIYIMLLFFA
jgi:hypothetical protein